MATIIIRISDEPGGKVKVEANPNFETMMKMDLSGNHLTSAHGVAIYALNQIRSESKRKTPTILQIPKIGRP